MATYRRTLLDEVFGDRGGVSKDRASTAVTGLRAALISLIGLAFAISGTAAPAVAAGYAEIHGVVTVPGGAVAKNAQVCLFAEPSAGWPDECSSTDSAGTFRFAGLAPGSYSLSASAQGYVTSYSGGSPYLKSRVPFELAGGQSSAQDLQLRSGAMITGRVVDSAGRPFSSDLRLSVRGPAEDPKPGAELQPGASADGRKPFSFGPVPDGTYRVVAESTITCTPQQVDPCQWTEAVVVVAGGRALSRPTLRLTGGTGFTGMVSFPGAAGSDPAPSRLYQLDVYNRSGSLVRSGVYEAATVKGTALVGRYRLDLDPGRYQLRFTPVDGTASYCLGCAGGVRTKTGRLLNLGTITLSGPVRALSTGGVRIDGSAVVGQTLSVVATGWPLGAELQYQWYRDGHRIRGATQATRVLTASDLHRRISVRVRGSLGGARSVQVTARLGSRVSRGQIVAGTAEIAGTAAVGQVLTVTNAGWQPSGVHLHYRWLRDGHSIRRATHAGYRLSVADLNHQISVRVTGTARGYHSAAVISAPVGVTAVG